MAERTKNVFPNTYLLTYSPIYFIEKNTFLMMTYSSPKYRKCDTLIVSLCKKKKTENIPLCVGHCRNHSGIEKCLPIYVALKSARRKP
jgi:hypothetical protein